MTRKASIFCFLFLVILLHSNAQYKESFAYRYIKTETLKKQKVKSIDWLTVEHVFSITPEIERIKITFEEMELDCKPFTETPNLKGTTGTVMIDGEESKCKIIIYNKETKSIPHVKITIYNGEYTTIKKFWFQEPTYYGE